MTSLLIILFAFVFGFAILSGLAAGIVSILYFWRNNRNTTQRALTAAFVSGLTCAGTMLGPMLIEGLGAAFESTVAMVVIVVICSLGSMPGAFIMSRKIAKSDPVGETFR